MSARGDYVGPAIYDQTRFLKIVPLELMTAADCEEARPVRDEGCRSGQREWPLLHVEMDTELLDVAGKCDINALSRDQKAIQSNGSTDHARDKRITLHEPPVFLSLP